MTSARPKGWTPTPFIMEELEPRLLLSADAAGGLVVTDTPEPPLPAPETAGGAATELVIIDPATPDYQALVEDLAEHIGGQVEVVVLDPGADGIGQITDLLRNRQDVAAIHIVSHGAEGRLELGGSRLDAATLETRSTELRAWGQALDEDGDILIYGCSLAGDAEGQALAARLADLTGADVAASTDLTGRGGDWDLEYRTGDIESSVAFSETLQATWSGTLSSVPYVVNNTGSTALEGGTDTITRSELLYATSHGSGDIIYSVTSGPANGQLELTTNPGVAINSFTQTDIDNNRLVYVHDGSSSPTSDSFTFDVRRQWGGGTNYNETFSFTITPVNDAPVVNDQGFSVDENSANGTVVGTVSASDEDGDALSYSIDAGDPGNAFSINSSTGEIIVNDGSQLDFESQSSYALTVTVDDGNGGTDTATATINLNDVNDAPVVNDQSFAVDENSANGTVVGTVSASDQDGDTLSYSITAGDPGGAFSIDTATGQITVADGTQLDFESQASYNLTIQVQDNGTGTLTDTATVTINLNDVNDAPVVNDQSFSVDENSANGTLVGTVSASDEDGDTLSYSITAGDPGGAFSIDAATGQITVADGTQLDFESQASYSLTVQVQDSGTGNLTDTATVTIDLNDVNEAPVINDQTLSMEVGSTIVGTPFAEDPDGNTLTYSIVANDSHSPADFAIDSATGEITVNSDSYLLVNTTHTLTVQVQDNGTGNLTDSAVITVNVRPGSNAPTIDAVTSLLDPVPEDSANGTQVADVDASDIDGDTVTYNITAGNTGNAFAIDPATGVISVNDSAALDFETQSNYSLTVEASDGALTDTTTVNINIGDVNDAPVVNDQTFAVDENSANGTSVGTVVADDQDGDTLSYSILPGTPFAIDSATGQITVADGSQLDFESQSSYSLTVTVDDGNGGTDTATVTINLNDLNDAPVVNDQSFAVDENAANGTSVGTVIASDQDGDTLSYSILPGSPFAIDSATGEITVADGSQLDFEAQASYSLTVQVQDNGTGTLTDTATVTINLNDVNDAPVVNDQSFAVDENSANGTVVGTISASDQDGDTLSYSIIAGDPNGAFAIDSATGEITVADGAQLDFESQASYSLTVQVQDNGTGTLTDTATVTIDLNDVNDAPVVNDQSFAVEENSPNGTVVGTVTASDQDGDTLSYSILTGNDASEFAIDPGTGVITIADSSGLDYETHSTLELVIQVTDNGTGNAVGQGIVTINLNDVNEAPVATDQTFTVNGQPVAGANVGAVVATDPESSTLNYAIVGGNDSGAFAIDPATGQITIADATALETGSPTSYTLQVQISDSGALTTTANVTIAVDFAPDPELGLQLPELEDGLPPSPLTAGTEPAIQTEEANSNGGRQPPLNLLLPALEGSLHFRGGSPITEAGLHPGPILDFNELQEMHEKLATEPGADHSLGGEEHPGAPAAGGMAVAGNMAPESFDPSVFWEALDRMNQDLSDPEAAGAPVVLAMTRGVVWSLSAGFVAWMLRAGSLLTTLLSSVPMWKWFDPLPVLALSRKERAEETRRRRRELEREAREYATAARVLDQSREGR